MVNGAAYGAGIYLAKNFGTSYGYAGAHYGGGYASYAATSVASALGTSDRMGTVVVPIAPKAAAAAAGAAITYLRTPAWVMSTRQQSEMGVSSDGRVRPRFTAVGCISCIADGRVVRNNEDNYTAKDENAIRLVYIVVAGPAGESAEIPGKKA